MKNNTRNRAKLGLFSTCALLATAACGDMQTSQETKTDTVADIAAVFSELEGVNAPGCAVGVKQGGEFIFSAGFGYADLETKTPITVDTPFDIASVSKQITVMAVMLAEQQGLLSLDDSVRKYVPELPEYADQINLKHMIYHISGLVNYTGLMPFAGTSVFDAVDSQTVIEFINRLESPNGPPGKYYAYNNTAYHLLAVSIERASGKTFSDFARDNIFTPLGMDDTGFVGRYSMGTRAEGYRAGLEGEFVPGTSPWTPLGAGMVITTINDFAKWDENFYTGKVGGQALVKAMVTPGKLDNGQELEYAGGLVVSSYKGHDVIRHSGSWIGFRTMYGRLPDLHTSVIVFCNREDASPGRYTGQVIDLLIKDHISSRAGLEQSQPTSFKALGNSADASTMPKGLYREPWKGGYVKLVQTGNGIALQDNVVNGDAAPLEKAGNAYKTAQDVAEYYFFKNEQGEIPKVVSSNNGALEEYELVASWSPDSLDKYVGSYRNAIFEIGFTIEKEGDVLFSFDEDGERMQLTPVGPNEFLVGRWMSIRFPDGAGDINSFELDTYHTFNLDFERQPSGR